MDDLPGLHLGRFWIAAMDSGMNNFLGMSLSGNSARTSISSENQIERQRSTLSDGRNFSRPSRGGYFFIRRPIDMATRCRYIEEARISQPGRDVLQNP
jgi:hypothetical protein